MKISILFVSLFLTWTAYDQNIFRRPREQFQLTAIEEFFSESEVQQKKQLRRHRLDVIPARYRNLRPPEKQRVNYFSTKPRDVRFSNQRKIRRMFNNL